MMCFSYRSAEYLSMNLNLSSDELRARFAELNLQHRSLLFKKKKTNKTKHSASELLSAVSSQGPFPCKDILPVVWKGHFSIPSLEEFWSLDLFCVCTCRIFRIFKTTISSHQSSHTGNNKLLPKLLPIFVFLQS